MKWTKKDVQLTSTTEKIGPLSYDNLLLQILSFKNDEVCLLDMQWNKNIPTRKVTPDRNARPKYGNKQERKMLLYNWYKRELWPRTDTTRHDRIFFLKDSQTQ